MSINKKIFLIIAAILLISLLFLIVLLQTIIQSAKNQLITPTPTVEPAITPVEINPTEIVPGTGAQEDGLPFENLIPTQNLINKIESVLNPFDVYAAVNTNVNSSNPLLFLHDFLSIFFSFSPSYTLPPYSPSPASSPPVGPTTPTPTYPLPTFNPTAYGPAPNKPYYNPAVAYRCYTPQRFIQVYANGVGSQAACWSDTKAVIEANLTRINLLGRNVPVHRKVAPFFSSVDAVLSPFKISGGRYVFPSRGDYNFSYVGTYAFRCNVNASTTRNLCSPNCTLSPHSFGFAVDINPLTNANGSSTFDMPPEVVQAFEANGFRWGGRYKDIFGSTVDAMHFEYLDEICR